MPKMVCLSCKVDLVIEKTGAVVADMFNLPPKPYKLYMADAWRCPGCGAVILVCNNNSYADHWEKDFFRKLGAALKVYKQWVVACFEKVGHKDEYPSVLLESAEVEKEDK